MSLIPRVLSLALLYTLLCVMPSAAVTIDDFFIVPLSNPLIASLGTPVTDFHRPTCSGAVASSP